MSTFKFETTSDEAAEALKSEIQGKTVLITGTSPKSIGSDAARAIATKSPALVILAGRNHPLNEETKAAILKDTPNANIRILDIDLASQKSVRKAAAEVNSYSEKIDVQINSAGLMATPYRKTADGIESQFGTNHIGHFLFTNLILPKFNDGSRVVNVTSMGYTIGPVRYDDYNFEKGPYDKWQGYGQSKTANILFSRSLAKKLAKRGILSFSVHPGPIKTNLGRDLEQADYDFLGSLKLQYKELPQGGATVIVAGFDPSIKDSNGGYMVDCQIEETSDQAPWAKGDENMEKLWELSQKIVGQKFDW